MDENIFEDSQMNKMRDILALKMFSKRAINILMKEVSNLASKQLMLYLMLHYPLLVMFVEMSP